MEIEEVSRTAEELAHIAEGVHLRNKPPTVPRQQIGFAGQSIERRDDRHPGGDPMWHSGNEPTTA